MYQYKILGSFDQWVFHSLKYRLYTPSLANAPKHIDYQASWWLW